MSNSNIHILSTGTLDESLLRLAASSGIAIHVLPFTDIIYTDKDILCAEFAHAELTDKPIVFTSAHAVRSVAGLLQTYAGMRIFCLSGATMLAVQHFYPSATIAATAENAATLAEKIIDARVQEIIFPCGNLRRDELPTLLAQYNIQVQEIIAYSTKYTPHPITGVYDAILFFSPGAVYSYLSVNTIAEGQTLFAIGATTASALREAGYNVVTSTQPGRQQVIDTVLEYYNIRIQNI